MHTRPDPDARRFVATLRRASCALVLATGACGTAMVSPGDDVVATRDAGAVDAFAHDAEDAALRADAADAAHAADAAPPHDARAPADAAAADASTGPWVSLGGTTSLGGMNNMHDLAVAANTARYRVLGGRLYVHELGWAHTSEADREAIARMYPDPPIWETGMPALTHAAQSIHDAALRYWPGGVAVACVNGVDITSTTDLRELHAAMVGRAARVGAYVSPNTNYAWRTPWSDAHWNNVRAGALIGGALCSDAPPDFYLAMEPSYRTFIADEIKWATSHGVVMVASLYPRTSTDEWADARNCVADLARQGATPDWWAVNAYYSNSATAPHPIGNEATPSDAAYTALQMAERVH